MVMALALIHHFAFVGDRPLEDPAEFFRELAPWPPIEFVPEDDRQVHLRAAQRAGVYQGYNQGTFERCFSKPFLIMTSEPVTDRGRTLYLLRRRGE